jgi:hypothetical protein
MKDESETNIWFTRRKPRVGERSTRFEDALNPMGARPMAEKQDKVWGPERWAVSGIPRM